ncbi:MAG: DUF262 domain-containing protein [Gammaproteobacteria bacterium]|nr:DUF262 domain-containing protein [Gammaproteobacteria bacterium]
MKEEDVVKNNDSSGGAQPDISGDPEGLDVSGESWGEYPLDELLIRHEHRSVHEVLRRIDRGSYVMNPDFQRDFIWPEDKQSKLIESVIMRIPLPVFYMAEDDQGRSIVVDGLQRLSTFRNYHGDGFGLRLSDRPELNGLKFSQLPTKFQNRIEDCNLIFYVIDAKAPERARLDIFERVNSGEPLTRQQMRNSLFMGKATTFLREEANSSIFIEATGSSLNRKTMRDREFVNRFCAFRLLGIDKYRGDMDNYLAESLTYMNQMTDCELLNLSSQFRSGLVNNVQLFDQHAFRRSLVEQERRTVINASLWDVMSTGLCNYSKDAVLESADDLRLAIWGLLDDEMFVNSISSATNDTERVQHRFARTATVFKEILGAPTD